jgi:predicted DCC family thiol-disulfide oxidoreductase YuxK
MAAPAPASLPEVSATHPVVLFDGVCNLCHGTVRFVIARDPAAQFRFAPLQSEVGRSLLRQAGLPEGEVDSVVLIDGSQAWQRSDATIRIVSRLGGGWALVRALLVLPRPLRNGVYDWVARNRYRWFGRREVCPVPSPEQRARFLA